MMIKKPQNYDDFPSLILVNSKGVSYRVFFFNWPAPVLAGK